MSQSQLKAENHGHKLLLNSLSPLAPSRTPASGRCGPQWAAHPCSVSTIQIIIHKPSQRTGTQVTVGSTGRQLMLTIMEGTSRKECKWAVPAAAKCRPVQMLEQTPH